MFDVSSVLDRGSKPEEHRVVAAVNDAPDSRHRRRRLHRLSCDAAAAVARPPRGRRRQHDALLRSRAEGSAAQRARKVQPFRVHQARSRRPRRQRRRCSPSTSFRMWCISQRRPACAIRISHPHAYVDANLQGFLNVLEGCRHNGCRASGVCVVVVGLWRQHQTAVLDVATMSIIRSRLYAASKKANELMAHSYAHLFRLPATGLRFFTVYGPWGRPDMAMWIFAKAILAGEPITLVQPRQDAARFHLCGRRGGIGGAPGRPSRRSPIRNGRATIPIRRRQLRALAHLQYRQQQSGRTCCTWLPNWKSASA